MERFIGRREGQLRNLSSTRQRRKQNCRFLYLIYNINTRIVTISKHSVFEWKGIAQHNAGRGITYVRGLNAPPSLIPNLEWIYSLQRLPQKATGTATHPTAKINAPMSQCGAANPCLSIHGAIPKLNPKLAMLAAPTITVRAAAAQRGKASMAQSVLEVNKAIKLK